MSTIASVSSQTQGPFISCVHSSFPHHVPESVIADIRFLQPRRIQSTVWDAGSVSSPCKTTTIVPSTPQRKMVDLEKMCLSRFRSAIHSVQPIELNFTDSPTVTSAGNTIQISMDCITMHEPEETFSVSTTVWPHSVQHVRCSTTSKTTKIIFFLINVHLCNS